MQRSFMFTALLLVACFPASAAEALRPIDSLDQRFQSADVEETPDFQRHVAPLMGRLGCNGRACHGSFQGRGGFQLSLFGYDFTMDHDALLEGRVDVDDPAESLILVKPTDADMHEGGLRYEKDGWEYHVFRRWIEDGAKFEKSQVTKLESLDITPSEVLFGSSDEKTQLKVVAVWADGTREDVTPLCRFQTNNEEVAGITENGLVSSGEPGDTHVVVFYDIGVVPVPVVRAVSDLAGDSYPEVPAPTQIDKLVVEKLRKLGIVPSELADDAEFFRRVSLDITGSLPTATEVEAFLADRSRNKREKKIDELLESPAYAAWWTTKICDFTGNNDLALNNITPVRSRATQDWYDWIHKRVESNVPYDKLVAGIVESVSRSPETSYTEFCEQMSDIYRVEEPNRFADLETMPYYWARRNFRTKEERAIGFAYTFLGTRIECAQCHKHPFDQWSKNDFEQFANLFDNVRLGNTGGPSEARKEYDVIVKALDLDEELRGNQLRREFPGKLEEGKTVPFPEIYVTETRAPRDGEGPTGKLLGDDVVKLAETDDPRHELMEWLGDKKNPYFARAFVNRVWAGYFNVGIVNPPDDMSLANPPSNKPLLDYLTEGFLAHDFDMKWLHREITNSRTYQLSWQPNRTNRVDTKNFSHAIPRRLPAEVAYDALVQATASDEKAAEMHRDMEGRAIAIHGAGSRSARGSSYAMTIFGKSVRENNCDCDRSSEASLLQTVFLQNDQEALSMIDRKRDGWLDALAKDIEAEQTPARRRAETVEKPKNYDQRVANMRQRVKNAKNPQAARAARQQLVAFTKQYAEPKPAAREPADTDTTKQIDEVVRRAYLRTLSRYPNKDELASSRKFVAESEDALDGVRGLLWALINTKEFIVNH